MNETLTIAILFPFSSISSNLVTLLPPSGVVSLSKYAQVQQNNNLGSFCYHSLFSDIFKDHVHEVIKAQQRSNQLLVRFHDYVYAATNTFINQLWSGVIVYVEVWCELKKMANLAEVGKTGSSRCSSKSTWLQKRCREGGSLVTPYLGRAWASPILVKRRPPRCLLGRAWASPTLVKRRPPRSMIYLSIIVRHSVSAPAF